MGGLATATFSPLAKRVTSFKAKKEGVKFGRGDAVGTHPYFGPDRPHQDPASRYLD